MNVSPTPRDARAAPRPPSSSSPRSPPRSPWPRRAGPAAVELIESRPVETAARQPGLRTATAPWIKLPRARGAASTSSSSTCRPAAPSHGRRTRRIGAGRRRGVRVRLILDAGMYRTYPRTADSLARVPGGVRLLTSQHRRRIQHAKYFIVTRTVFLGSQNFDWRALKHIHELCVANPRPPRGAEYQRIYEMDWTWPPARQRPTPRVRGPCR